MKSRYILVLLIAIIGTLTYGQESNSISKTADSSSCIDSSDFKIGSIYIEQKISDVVNLIGHPDSIVVDSGLMFHEVYYYKDLIVYHISDTVFGIVSISNRYMTPQGIQIGLSRNKVFEMLDLKTDSLSPREHKIEFIDCHNKNYAIELIFDDAFILSGIVLAVDLF